MRWTAQSGGFMGSMKSYARLLAAEKARAQICAPPTLIEGGEGFGKDRLASARAVRASCDRLR
ncbi:hypothetical protein [Sphingomonas sp.]|uniref:hypothetical protein n=1 Tax=Sphingomonas sp. TaxID=28214 RepID=UPI0031E0730B